MNGALSPSRRTDYPEKSLMDWLIVIVGTLAWALTTEWLAHWLQHTKLFRRWKPLKERNKHTRVHHAAHVSDSFYNTDGKPYKLSLTVKIILLLHIPLGWYLLPTLGLAKALTAVALAIAYLFLYEFVHYEVHNPKESHSWMYANRAWRFVSEYHRRHHIYWPENQGLLGAIAIDWLLNWLVGGFFSTKPLPDDKSRPHYIPPPSGAATS